MLDCKGSLDIGTCNDFRAVYRDSINKNYPAKAGELQATASGTSLDHMLDSFRQAALSNLNTLFDHVDRTTIDRARRRRCERKQTLQNRVRATKERVDRKP